VKDRPTRLGPYGDALLDKKNASATSVYLTFDAWYLEFRPRRTPRANLHAIAAPSGASLGVPL